MRLGVWLLLALLPLRALASVEMAVAMLAHPTGAAVASALPPCHGPLAAVDHGDGHEAGPTMPAHAGATGTEPCACGLVCAPALAGAAPGPCAAPAPGTDHAAPPPGAVPQPVPEPFFRPPRA